MGDCLFINIQVLLNLGYCTYSQWQTVELAPMHVTYFNNVWDDERGEGQLKVHF
jgi:hypothetical protein